jgi:hypothetical protein
MVWITAESVTSAITLSVPPHSGQTDISISKTRLSRSAQLRGAVGKSRSTADSAEAGVAGFFRFLCAGFAEPGTTALLNGETEADYCPKNGPRGGYEFFPTIGRNEAKIDKFSYRSGSTDVIGWVLEEATGQPLAELISMHIWKPMGAEFDAFITVDESGFVLADHGMKSTLRDLGRAGLLVLNKGVAFGQQVVPADFIEDMHAQPGDPTWPYASTDDLEPYYRSFWWGKGNDGRELSGSGIHGQTLVVAPEAGIVIALYSTWPRADGDNTTQYWGHNEDFMDALVAHFR